MDGGTAVVNVVLLLLLFALAFERILGLDKVSCKRFLIHRNIGGPSHGSI